MKSQVILLEVKCTSVIPITYNTKWGFPKTFKSTALKENLHSNFSSNTQNPIIHMHTSMNIWCFADGFEGLIFNGKRENLNLNHNSELVTVIYWRHRYSEDWDTLITKDENFEHLLVQYLLAYFQVILKLFLAYEMTLTLLI